MPYDQFSMQHCKLAFSIQLLVFFFLSWIAASMINESAITIPAKVKVLDYFLFNGEPIGLFRINYLRDVVDHFIIAEFNETFTGLPKISYLDLYKDFLNPFEASGQLIKIQMSFPAHLKKCWDREEYQRNFAANFTLAFMDNQKFLLIISDGDELPRNSMITKARQNYENYGKPYHLETVFLYYSFKWMVPDTWMRQFIVNDKGLREISNLNSIDYTRRQFYSTKRIIKNAGWHCSYCFNSTEISRKLQSFSHQEFNSSYYTNITRIEKQVELGMDLFNRSDQKPFVVYKGLSTNGQHFGYPVCDKKYADSPLMNILLLPKS
jgi:beta-1,4-mannosyl-glycoprotein beta-1,4-N-acetylglucosaminyltransferase